MLVVQDFDFIFCKAVFIILQYLRGAAGNQAGKCHDRCRYASETFHPIIILQIYLKKGFSQNFSHNLCRPAANGAGLHAMDCKKMYKFVRMYQYDGYGSYIK